jgi:hypothetical protein
MTPTITYGARQFSRDLGHFSPIQPRLFPRALYFLLEEALVRHIANEFCFVSMIQTLSPLLISNTDSIGVYNASTLGWSSITQLAAATASLTATSVEWKSSFNSAVALFGGGGGHVLFY